MNPRLRLVLALVALAAGLVNLALLLRAGDDRPRPLAYLLISVLGVSWSFVAAGLVAWTRRPGNRTGALMVAVGLSYALIGLLVNGVVLVATPAVFALWYLLRTLPEGVIPHLLAVFPDGRATTRLQRVFIVANYAATVPLAMAELLLVDPDRLGCTGCPEDLLAVGTRRPYGDVVLTATNVSYVALGALLLWIMVVRWRRASGPLRRSLAPVALVALVLVVAYAIREALRAAAPSPPLVDGLDLVVITTLMLWPLAFLAGLARTRLDRSAVGELAVELSEPLPPGRLEQALAGALHDPTVELAYWLPERQAFVDAAGRPVELPAPGGGRSVTVLRHGGDPVAALLHDPVLDDDPQLVRAVAATARLAVENQRLQAEVRAQLEEVRASRARIVAFGDAERRRVERNLHDGAQQRLVNLSLALGIARAQLGAGATGQDLAAALDEAAAELRLALAELRELAHGIHPVVLSEAGLGPALAGLAERSPVPVTVAAVPPGRFPSAVEEAAYYVACEALANAAKHARASAVSVSARRCDRGLVVEVGDDGVGGADPDGSGLRGLADRVAALDGRLEVRSRAGEGTWVTAELPCGW
jgi:signal transduction histidine kinase